MKGFEPLAEYDPRTDVPGLHLKPLGHISALNENILSKINNYFKKRQ